MLSERRIERCSGKKALITGVLGQDGSYMAEVLNRHRYEVVGLIRVNTHNKEKRVKWIKNLVPHIKIMEIDITQKQSVLDIINHESPDEIYNFAGYSDVFNPWDNLDSIYKVNCKIPQNFLEAIAKSEKVIKFFQASSSLIYGRTQSEIQNEETPFAPLHPYGITKLYAHNMVVEFRKKYGIFGCSAIFFNHDSARRGDNFFTKKIIGGIKKILNNEMDKLTVGDLSNYRDIGDAREYMQASFLMMQNEDPIDYVIGTGALVEMEEFVKKSFTAASLNWEDYIIRDKSLFRPSETQILKADIKKIKEDLGWYPTQTIDDIIEHMLVGE
jgi:GDPmannose 4,6-dehydratase